MKYDILQRQPTCWHKSTRQPVTPRKQIFVIENQCFSCAITESVSGSRHFAETGYGLGYCWVQIQTNVFFWKRQIFDKKNRSICIPKPLQRTFWAPGEAFSPTENSSNMKFLPFSLFCDNFGLPGSGSDDPFKSGSETLLRIRWTRLLLWKN